jgi:hypothetical protein
MEDYAMNQMRTELTPTRIDDADRWARAAMVARAIPDDVDLSDDADVCRALMANRLCAADFDDILDEAIERARDNRISQ